MNKLSQSQKEKKINDHLIKMQEEEGAGRQRGPGFGRGPGPGPMSKPKNPKVTLKRLFGYLSKQRIIIFIAILLVIVQSISSAYIIPVTFANTIRDYMGVNASSFDKAKVINSAYIIGTAGVVYGISMYIKTYIMVKMGQRLVRDIRQEAFDNLQSLPVSYYDKNSSGGVVSRITNDIDSIANAVVESLVQLITSIMFMSVALFTIVSQVPLLLSIPSIVLVPIVFITMAKIMKKMFKHFSMQQRQIASINSLVEETIYGLTAVKLYSQEEEVLKDFEEKNIKLRDASFKAQFTGGMVGPIVTVFNNIIYVVIIALGAFLMINNINTMFGIKLTSVDIASIGLATAATAQLMNPVRNMGQLFGKISSALAGGERVFKLMDEESEYTKDGSIVIDGIKGDVEFKDVTFSYEQGKEILKNITFTASAGETIAIVGPTGSGKTTIINLLSKFYDIDSGTILIDGQDINEINKQSLRRKVGVVLQDNYLMKTSVYENIKYGKEDATSEEVIAAAEKANADGFISRLPNGYEQEVASGGENFSLGERQLISIARTMIVEPDLLILDEATSSVDTKTEKSIIDAMEKLAKGRTTFVIAHRLQTIRNADKIIVLKDGQIKEFGPHKELIDKKGMYYDLYTTQFKD